VTSERKDTKKGSVIDRNNATTMAAMITASAAAAAATMKTATNSAEAENRRGSNVPVRFRVTGRAAHSRIAPLVPSDWIDVSPSLLGLHEKKEEQRQVDSHPPHDHPPPPSPPPPPDFVWENCPQKDTKPYRDRLKCYSHLPNGLLLDSKWALARLLSAYDDEEEHDDQDDDHHRQLETHCFRGMSGLRRIEKRLLRQHDDCGSRSHDGAGNDRIGGGENGSNEEESPMFYDLMHPDPSWEISRRAPSSPSLRQRWWAVKDAGANGAGGVWIVTADTMSTYLNPETSPLHEDHDYVAQEYVWPPVLYNRRKCHARVYGLLTGDGRAFVHSRAFLHVANDPFTLQDRGLTSSVHITNCCANSHDSARFAGEILATLQGPDEAPVGDDSSNNCNGNEVVPLAEFAESIHHVVATLAHRSRTFVQGGQANGGFEYLGLDFAMSHDALTGKPKAYLLEVNAPPSQDTATGLPHAEALHNTVLADLLSLWVLPKVLGAPERAGGWNCVHGSNDSAWLSAPKATPGQVPSQVALLNRMRWAMRERKAAKRVELYHLPYDVGIIRDQFPYFSGDSNAKTFFENAGGAQVPRHVSEKVAEALKSRSRTGVGQQAKDGARATMHTLLGASSADFDVYFGSNATTLLALLSQEIMHSGFLTKGDEIIVSTDNHTANLEPWLKTARQVGATVLWCESSSVADVAPLVSARTRIVAVTHASNILGQVRDVRSICQFVRDATSGRAHIVVDGVAAVPHVFADLDSAQPDWYVVSCHKQFGPHIGVLCGRKASSKQLGEGGGCRSIYRSLEVGTINYEACAGIEGLGLYFLKLAEITSGGSLCSLDRSAVQSAYRLISSLEKPLIEVLDETLGKDDNVRVIIDRKNGKAELNRRIPVVSFVHHRICSSRIVQECLNKGIVCRNGAFLSCSRFQQAHGFDEQDGVVRISLVHYNTADELKQLANVLQSIVGWM
jgi:selenocysteine lyase/cysteine desulfurase